MRYLAKFAHTVLLLLAITGLPALAESPNVTVTIVGTGPTISEAKTNAIRNALQQTLKQLVVADRLVSDDTVLKDRVFSTVNGYVEAYNELSVQARDGGFQIEAEITVSASRIENFLGIVAGGAGKFSGTLLSRELQKSAAQSQIEAAQRKARGEIFDRTLEAFPWSAFQVELLNVDIKKIGAADRLVLRFRQKYDPRFVSALIETAAALAAITCEPTAGVYRNSVYDCMNQYKPDTQMAVCVERTKIGQCYLLEHGDYCSGCQDVNLYGVLIGRFIDETGANAMRGDKCRSFPPGNWTGVYRLFDRIRVGGNGLRIEIDTDETATFEIEVEPSGVDIERAAYFVGVMGLEGRTERTKNTVMTSALTNPNQNTKDACLLVDDAVQHHMITRAKGQ